MKKLSAAAMSVFLLLLTIAGCKKADETVHYASAIDYFPLQVGRVMVYRLDSTLLANINRDLVTKSYQAMDTVESTFTDNPGRLSYRIFRYLRDTAGTQPWIFSNTFTATPTAGQVEFVDENFRFIKLHSPVKTEFTWQGNSYIDTRTDNSYLDGWNYTYQDVNTSYMANGTTYDSTATVLQQDEFSPEGPFDPTLSFQQRDYSVEVYAKGVGLVYKDLLHWVWQSSHYDDDAYGVRLMLISHN